MNITHCVFTKYIKNAELRVLYRYLLFVMKLFHNYYQDQSWCWLSMKQDLAGIDKININYVKGTD